MSATTPDGGGQRGLKFRRAKPNGMAGQQEKESLRLRDLSAKFQQRHQLGFNTERLSFGAVAERGRVEDHGIVLVASPQFTLYKRDRIFRDPANRSLRQVGSCRVVPGPLNNVLRPVDVRYFGAGGGGGQGASPGIGEQVEYFGGSIFDGCLALRHPLMNPVPIVCLFGEDPQVSEGGRF